MILSAQAQEVTPSTQTERAKLIQSASEKTRPEYFSDPGEVPQNSGYGDELTTLALPEKATAEQVQEYLRVLYRIIERHPEVPTSMEYRVLFAKLKTIPPEHVEWLLDAAAQGHYVPYEIVDARINDQNAGLLWKYLKPGVIFYNQESSTAFEEGTSWDLYPPNILDLILSRNLHKGRESEILKAFTDYFSGAEREKRFAEFHDIRYLQAMGRLGLYPELNLSWELLQKGMTRDSVFAYLYGRKSPYSRPEMNERLLKEETERCRDSQSSNWKDELLTDLVLQGNTDALKFLIKATSKDAKGVPRFRLVWALDKENNCLFVRRNRQLNLGDEESRAKTEKELVSEHLWFERFKLSDANVVGLSPRGNPTIVETDQFYQKNNATKNGTEATQWLNQNGDRIKYLPLLRWMTFVGVNVRGSFEDIGVFYIDETPAWLSTKQQLASLSPNLDAIQKQADIAKILAAEKRELKGFSANGFNSGEILLGVGRRTLGFGSLSEVAGSLDDPIEAAHLLSGLYQEGKGKLPGENGLDPEELFTGRLGPEHTQLIADHFPMESSLQLIDLRKFLPSWRRILAPAVAAGLKYVSADNLLEWHVRTATATDSNQAELMRVFYEGWRFQGRGKGLRLMPLDFVRYVIPTHSSELRKLVADIVIASPYANKPPELVEECRRVQDNAPVAEKSWVMREWKEEKDFNQLIQVAALLGYQSALQIVCEQLKNYPPSDIYNPGEGISIPEFTVSDQDTRRDLYRKIEQLIQKYHIPTKLDYSQLSEEDLNYKGFPPSLLATMIRPNSQIETLAMVCSRCYSARGITQEDIVVVHTPGLLRFYPKTSPEFIATKFFHVSTTPFLNAIRPQIVDSRFKIRSELQTRNWLVQNFSTLVWDDSLQKYRAK